jgi:hypothetical protein
VPHPENWISNGDRPIGGRTIVFDLDGVIADAGHRQHFVPQDRSVAKNWLAFFNACVDDPLIEQGRRLIGSVSDEFCVVIITARIHDTREKTVTWLAANEVRHDWLILRGPREGAPSTEWKQTQLEQLQEAGAEIELALDDDPRNIDMVRSVGLTAMYIHSGYYNDRDLDVEFP